jgi:glycosyltransferase involved in cell wall biosynthesis
MKTILWWGRFDPEYSRNRVVRQAFEALGWSCQTFHPRFSVTANWEARWRGLVTPDLVWVPCFRQRDVLAARRWCDHHKVPLVFDPLISSYDKQVYERRKFPAESRRARRLLQTESAIFRAANRVVADTEAHAVFFHQVLEVPRECLFVVPVGAEEPLFRPAPTPAKVNSPIEVLFYGSFLSLQGPEVIVEAARRYQGPPVRWCLLGDGPLRPACEAAARGLGNVSFENWAPYSELPERIRRADILLGIFGDSAKAARVVPNKVFQALACAKPLVTRSSTAYPEELRSQSNSGIAWVPANDPGALAEAVARLATEPERLPAIGQSARKTYEEHFSAQVVQQRLENVLRPLAGR